MLEISGLVVSYGAVEAVRGIDLSVGAGELVALLGPNGAGKTSALRALCRLEPSRGQITFDGDDLSKVGTDAVARMGLVMVPEGRRVFPTLTVHENLLVGQSAQHGRTPVFGLDDVYDLFPALPPLRKRHGRALSGGEQQMVAVGRALVAAPKFLLLDEPSLGLSPLATTAVFGALREVAQRVGMLLVEQQTTSALEICLRAHILSEGRIVLSGPRSELQDRDELIASYLQGGSIEQASRGAR